MKITRDLEDWMMNATMTAAAAQIHAAAAAQIQAAAAAQIQAAAAAQIQAAAAAHGLMVLTN